MASIESRTVNKRLIAQWVAEHGRRGLERLAIEVDHPAPVIYGWLSRKNPIAPRDWKTRVRFSQVLRQEENLIFPLMSDVAAREGPS